MLPKSVEQWMYVVTGMPKSRESNPTGLITGHSGQAPLSSCEVDKSSY